MAQELDLGKGSLILVTGASGYIGSHVVNEALGLGYRVRGTVRSQEKGEETWKLFKSNDFEYFVVPDMVPQDAYADAVKDVDAIIHIASVMTFDCDPNNVIPQTIAGVTGILKCALSQPSVKRFVYCSSSTALLLPRTNEKFKIDKTFWNKEAVEKAWAPPPYTIERAFNVYAASKTQAEQAVWDFVEKNKPRFAVNAVLPNFNFGRILGSPGASGELVIAVFKGKTDFKVAPQYMIDVVDDARLHVAAAIDGSLRNERIIAFAHPWNVNVIIRTCKEARPEAELPGEVPGVGDDLSEPDNGLGKALLKKWWGQDGYKSLLQTVRENLEKL